MKILLMAAPIMLSEDPAELAARDDQDNSRIPIGLYSIGAVLLEKRIDTRVENFSLLPLSGVVRKIGEMQPDLLGISCYTANRHVVTAICRAVKTHWPDIRIILGGPHPSQLYYEILSHVPEVDFVSVGENEISFPDLVERLAAARPLHGINGIAYRENQKIIFNGPASLMEDLDSLPLSAKYFSYHSISTSRGCPGDCSFCASPTIWGRRVRYRRPERILEEIDLLVNRHGISQIAFKDDTFTTKRSRLITLLQSMIARQYDLQWSCDTRIDSVDEEKLYWMKKAGCTRISYGVESGSEAILKEIGKQITLPQIKKAAALTRKYCIPMRFYLIVGNIGETNETLGETIRLVEETKPNICFISKLTVSPGTRVFDTLSDRGHFPKELWRDDPRPVIYADIQPPVENYPNYARLVGTYHVKCIQGAIPGSSYSVDDRLSVVSLLGGDAADHYLLGRELYQEEKFFEAAERFALVLEMTPSHQRAHMYLALCCERIGNDTRAEQTWRVLLTLPTLLKENALFSLLQLGRLYHRMNQMDASKAVFQRLLALDGSAFEGFTGLGEVYLSENNPDEAMATVETSIALNPDYADTYNLMGKCLVAKGNMEGAETAFWDAFHRGLGDKSEVFNNLGVVWWMRQDRAKAKHYFTLALAENPDNMDARANLIQMDS